MLTEIQNTLITRLQEISAVALVDAWLGDEEDLLTQPARVPALYLVYEGTVFEPKGVIGANLTDSGLSYGVILINKNLQSRRKCSEDCNTIIEAVRAKLTGYEVLTYGWAWPVSEELISAESGILMYGLRYGVHLKKQ